MQKSCGTAACLAGHTLLQHGGYELAGNHAFRRTADGEYFTTAQIGDEAQKLLGMSRDDRYYRFHGDIFHKASNETALGIFRTLVAESEEPVKSFPARQVVECAECRCYPPGGEFK